MQSDDKAISVSVSDLRMFELLGGWAEPARVSLSRLNGNTVNFGL